eukprot:TRINITY_DN8666_c0_g2_i1.p1 TRINITY_DN8666_c0_g2~~TRINITY_DN8666_c0_g2_i1.p1  ORF type:complete len:995 (+),score=284.06 TRINITY_DN8666_c0_g2_i1:314-2986(+)
MKIWPSGGVACTSADPVCSAARGERYVGTDPNDCSNKDPSGLRLPAAIDDENHGGPDTPDVFGYVEFPFQLSEPALVSIKVRLHAPDSLSDSFWAQMGTAESNQTKMKWSLASRESLWGWQTFAPNSVTQKSLRQACQLLPPGDHFFRLFVREPGAAVDMVNFTSPDAVQAVSGVSHEGCSGGCSQGGGSTARFSVANICGPDTLSELHVTIGGVACGNPRLEAQTVLSCTAPAFAGVSAPVVIWQAGVSMKADLLYREAATSSDNEELLIGALSGAGGLAIVAAIVAYFSTSRMRNMRKMLSTAQIAEDMAEKVAKMELEQLEYLTDIEHPTNTQKSFQTIVKALTYYKTYLPESLFTGWQHEGRDASDTPSFRSYSQSGVTAPGLVDGMASIVFTDIQGSTSVWEATPTAMRKALSIHNRVIRECIQEFHGYEVKTIGDAFMAAFETVVDAANFALAVQESLLETNEWPPELSQTGLPNVQQAPGWNGLRLRIGVNTGEVDIETDPFTSRCDYFGHTVNKAARLENACIAGGVCIPQDVIEVIRNEGGMRQLGDPIEIPMGKTTLKGVQEKADLMLLLPQPCAARSNAVQEVLMHKQSATGPVRASVASTTVPRKEAKDTRMLEFSHFQESFEPVASATVAHIRIGFTDLVSNVREPHVTVNNLICAVIVANERTEGSIISLHSNSVVIGWNTGHRCSSHQQAALRFSGLALKTFDGHETGVKAHIGIATGNALYGKVGSRGQKFVTVIGFCVEVAEEVVILASGLSVFAAAASLPGHRSLASDPGFKHIVRPIATLPAPNNNQEFYVHEIRCSAFMRGGLMVGYHPDSGELEDWGWSEEYKSHFKSNDFQHMRGMSADPVVLAVCQRMEEGLNSVALCAPDQHEGTL